MRDSSSRRHVEGGRRVPGSTMTDPFPSWFKIFLQGLFNAFVVVYTNCIGFRFRVLGESFDRVLAFNFWLLYNWYLFLS